MGIGLGDFISLHGVQPDRFATAGGPWGQASSEAWAYSWLWPQQWKENDSLLNFTSLSDMLDFLKVF